jgi:hypothetical protein
VKEFDWGEVSYRLIETGFVDWRKRDKTIDSIKRVTDKIPDEELGILLNRIGIIFAPDDSKAISIKPFPGSLELFLKGKLMIYFPTEIENSSDEQIDSVVANEFARVLLCKKDEDGYFILSLLQKEISLRVQQWGLKPISG